MAQPAENLVPSPRPLPRPATIQVGSESPAPLLRTGDPHAPGLELGLSPAVFAAHQFPQRAESVARSRAFVTRCLDRWRITPSEGPPSSAPLLVVSELVTNAVKHGVQPAPRPPGTLWLVLHLLHPGLLCAVTDPSPAPPQPHISDVWSTAGRGLHVIDTLAADWGWTPSPAPGKTVWALLPPNS
ncbi:ATP-binding protein [Streptomyces xanthochromogenes]|uniref:ATP-binding protein n=1 Tax=Streptomyces xanthochromogenes TaxID=67384 RepID=UPI003449E52A